MEVGAHGGGGQPLLLVAGVTGVHLLLLEALLGGRGHGLREVALVEGPSLAGGRAPLLLLLGGGGGVGRRPGRGLAVPGGGGREGGGKAELAGPEARAKRCVSTSCSPDPDPNPLGLGSLLLGGSLSRFLPFLD